MFSGRFAQVASGVNHSRICADDEEKRSKKNLGRNAEKRNLLHTNSSGKLLMKSAEPVKCLAVFFLLACRSRGKRIFFFSFFKGNVQEARRSAPRGELGEGRLVIKVEIVEIRSWEARRRRRRHTKDDEENELKIMLALITSKEKWF